MAKQRGEIGEYNGDFFYNQEANLCVSNSSCEELEEDDFLERDYAADEFRSLEELRWPEECLYSMEIYNNTRKHVREMGKKKKRGNVALIMGGESAQEGDLVSPPL